MSDTLAVYYSLVEAFTPVWTFTQILCLLRCSDNVCVTIWCGPDWKSSPPFQAQQCFGDFELKWIQTESRGVNKRLYFSRSQLKTSSLLEENVKTCLCSRLMEWSRKCRGWIYQLSLTAYNGAMKNNRTLYEYWIGWALCCAQNRVKGFLRTQTGCHRFTEHQAEFCLCLLRTISQKMLEINEDLFFCYFRRRKIYRPDYCLQNIEIL